MQGLIVWLCRPVSLSPVGIVSHNPFSVFSEASISIRLRKGRRKRSDDCVERRLRASLPYHMQDKCCHKTLNPHYHESKWVWVSRPWIKSLPSRCTVSPKKIKDGNNREGRQQQCLSSSNQVATRKHKKAKKTQQSTTKVEAADTFGCWKRRECFKADGRGLGA
jgi:hypothetical protein